jgi:hypothetical protein
MSIKDFETLLNTGKLKIDLDYVKKVILEDIPRIRITGRLEGTSNRSLSYYNCLKFIGQFTNSQQVYDQCLDILYAMPENLEGPIFNPVQVLHFLGFNTHVDTSKNKYKEETKEMLASWSLSINKSGSFRDSIYLPNPSQEREYERYKVEIESIYYDMTNSETDQFLGCICFASYILQNRTWEFDFHKVNFKFRSNLTDIALKTIHQHLLDVYECNPTVVNTDIMIKVEETLRFLSPKNTIGIIYLFGNICSEISNEKSEHESFEKRLLIEIYERKIVSPDSKLSHNFMREVAESGRLWILKFLIEKGCPIKNLPKYGVTGQFWVLENKQIRQILEEKVEDPYGFGKDWIEQMRKDKLTVLTYLLTNNLL